MTRFISILLFIFIFPFMVSAQCLNPPAEMGVLIMNKKHKVMQYCNGDDWIGLWGGSASSPPLCTGAGKTLQWDGTGWTCIDDGGEVPVQRISGEVVSFDLTTCPDGWSEYLPARGRFIRGIDNGAGNDPDGTRTSGHVQADGFRSHAHTGATDSAGNHNHRLALGYMGANQGIGVGYGDAGTGGTTRDAGAHTHTFTTSAVGAAETRPKNVALLYCRKD